MKKTLLIFFTFFNLLSLNKAVQAQCSTVTVTTYQPSVGSYKVRATIPHPFSQNIEIMGSITPEGEPTTGYELTIFAGNLTGETDQTWQQSQPPTLSSTFSVSICPPNLSSYWQNELDNIGITHNEAMDYAFQRLQQENLSNLTEQRVRELAAMYIAEFYTNRYGATFNFSQNDLYSDLLNNPITPPNHNTLSISNELKQTITSILSVLDQTESASVFESQVTNIVNQSIGQLAPTEQIYLTAYRNLVIKSFEYWTQNSSNWDQFSGSTSSSHLENAQTALAYSFNSLDILEDQKKDFINVNVYQDKYLQGPNQYTEKWWGHPCARAVVSSDAGGVLFGAIQGCGTGALFGAHIGCGAGAIFWGAVRGSVSSLGSAIACWAYKPYMIPKQIP
jgi:hypothetical protein